MTKKTHYRTFSKSAYLSSEDLIEPINVTISKVVSEEDRNKKTKEKFAVAYFKEKEIRKDEDLKPMILNSTNRKMLVNMTGEEFIEDWADTEIEIYVDPNVRFARDTVEGLRIRPQKKKEQIKKEQLSDERFAGAIESIKAGKFTKESLLSKFDLTEEQLKSVEAL